MSPNQFNDSLLQYKKIALTKGLSALSQEELLLMFTRPYVQRGIGPEVPCDKDRYAYEPCGTKMSCSKIIKNCY